MDISKAEQIKALRRIGSDKMYYDNFRLERALKYAKHLENKRGVCECCGVITAFPVQDHNHATGQWRGVICRTCNVHLGYVEWERDNAQRHEQLMDYLKRTDAQYARLAGSETGEPGVPSGEVA